MSLKNITASVQLSSTDPSTSQYSNSYTGWSMGSGTLISSHIIHYQSQVEITLSLTFNSFDESCFPGPPRSPTPQPLGSKKALRELVQASLRGPSPVDTKFYLYSAKVGRQAARPKPLFVDSNMLRDSAPFWKNMLSEIGFRHGISCDLFVDDPGVIHKLSSNDYDYDSDSDLESIADERDAEFEKVTDEQGELSVVEADEKSKILFASVPRSKEVLPSKAAGLAYAINGTAYRTLEAYIMHAYTDDIGFDSLRSTRSLKASQDNRKNSNEAARCSPKSMYRFADYANIPALKAKARAGIEDGLTKENIITELFSTFTSKYDDIIELETEFFVKNYGDNVERALNIILHTKQYHSRTLIFALKRLRGGNVKAAWEVANLATS